MPESNTRWVVWDGPDGIEDGAEGEVTGVAIFRKGVPTELPEKTAEEIVKLAKEKAGEVKDPLPPHFRYATGKEVTALRKDEKAAAEAAAAAEEPAEEED